MGFCALSLSADESPSTFPLIHIADAQLHHEGALRALVVGGLPLLYCSGEDVVSGSQAGLVLKNAAEWEWASAHCG